ncbi:hypothetical protein BC1002_5677 [Paraburkholderia atlantica]|uniref:Uncharacterized protein n=1 Tax=Paraburkholderia atlantica TaxID=2654982 RepID=D5WK40_PARAM|nr:hypothetical protein [Paraburkholderia atlantica]ADG19586.1 hypothetical protein BC1002_5677 [Paraburkholderia atlantica]
MAAPLLKYRTLPTARIGIDELRSYVVRRYRSYAYRTEGFSMTVSGRPFLTRTGSFIRSATMKFSFISWWSSDATCPPFFKESCFA